MSTCSSTARLAALILGFICFLMIGHLQAEHEADHRYSIRGYLLDAEERGIVDEEVVVFNGGKLIGSGKTDSSGYYTIHLHLHNSDLRRKLTLRAGSSQAQLQVKFDPADKSTIRYHEANFVGGEFVEGDLGHFRLPTWIYPLAGLIAIGLVLVKLEKRRRAKIHKRAAVASPSHGKRKSKKRRRKS